MRHGAFGRIDQQQRPIGHLQHAFDLAAKISVPRRVNDIDLCSLVGNRDILRQDRDPALAFQITRIQDPLTFELRLAELAGLP